MNIQNLLKQKILQTYSNRNLSTQITFQKSVQVCILGAHTPLGRTTSFLLKQNPLLSVLRLQGDMGVKNLGVDLSFIDTRCKVQSFEGVLEISKSIRSADIVVILGKDNVDKNASLVDRVMDEGKRIYDIAKKCTEYAPRSIILVCVKPVSFSTVVVEEVFRKTDWYHPARIIGSPAHAQVKANTMLGRYQDMDPKICNVPMIGGPDIDLAVPLFSRASPVELMDRAAKYLLATYRKVDVKNFPNRCSQKDYFEFRNMSEAFGLNHMISNIGLGICGADKAYYSAYIRANLVDACKHLVTTVKFSRGGVIHNCGVPQLTRLELLLLEKAALEIKKREQMAKQYFEHADGNCEPPQFLVEYLQEKKRLQQQFVRP